MKEPRSGLKAVVFNDKLYAIGNDMHSIMGGVYPAPGITIGPGMVFAYLAVKSALAPR